MDNCTTLEFLLASLGGVCFIASISCLTWTNDLFSWIGFGRGALTMVQSPVGLVILLRVPIMVTFCLMLPRTHGMYLTQASISTTN